METSKLRSAWQETVGHRDIDTLTPDATYKPAVLGPALAPPLEEAPGYVPVEEIGRGGFGVVYRAAQTNLGRDVALKLAKGVSTKESGFIQEACLHGQLEHPNIVPVHDLGRREGSLFLAMKLVEGRPWSELLRGPGREDLDRHLEVLDALCHAVDYAHSRGIVHNDLKPANVLLGAFGEVQLTDWGLGVCLEEDPARPWLRPRTAICHPCGTPSYMAPELALGHGEEIGPWTDIYLLGGILLRILTGSPPHRGKSLWRCACDAAAKLPPRVDGVADPELREICRRALAPEPAERFPSAGALREALGAWRGQRQSVTLTEQAEEVLAGCEAGPAADDGARLRQYEGFSRALAGFEQALGLWPANLRARDGLRRAGLVATEAALAAGDLGLAEAHLPDDAPELATRIAAARTTREQERLGRRRLQRAVRGAIALIVVAGLVGVGFLLDSNARLQATYGELRESRDEVLAERERALEAEGAMRAAAAAAQSAESAALAGRSRAESILDFAFSTLRGKLAPLGQRHLLLPAADETVQYFAGLPVDADPARRLGRARALANVATLYRQLGYPERARAPASEAVSLLEGWEADGAVLLDAWREHALVERGAAGLRHAGRARALATRLIADMAELDAGLLLRGAAAQRALAELFVEEGALDSADVALAVGQAWAARLASRAAWQQLVGARAELCLRRERYDEALELGRLRVEAPGDGFEAAGAQLALGLLYERVGRAAEAEEALRAARARLLPLAEADLAQVDRQAALCETRAALARVRRAAGASDEARGLLIEARNHLRLLWESFPASLLHQGLVVHTALGTLLIERGELELADATLRTALRLVDTLDGGLGSFGATLEAAVGTLATLLGRAPPPRLREPQRLRLPPEASLDAAEASLLVALLALAAPDAAAEASEQPLAALEAERTPAARHRAAQLLVLRAEALRRLGRLDGAQAALTLAGQALAHEGCVDPGRARLQATIVLERGRCAWAAGAAEEAREAAASALAALADAPELEARALRVQAGILAADAFLARGAAEEAEAAARAALEEAWEAAGRSDHPRWLRLQAACLQALARCLAARDPDAAAQLEAEARRLVADHHAADPRARALRGEDRP